MTVGEHVAWPQDGDVWDRSMKQRGRGGMASKGMRSRKGWLGSDSEGFQIYLKVYFVINERS